MNFNEYYSPEKYDPYSIESIFNYAKGLKDYTLADKCHSDILEKSYAGKGNFGHYLEKFYFGFNPNNNPEPDFRYVDVELKSGAIVETSKGFRAKERLAIGAKGEDPRNYRVSNVNIVQYTNSEIAQIRDDWNLIKNKVSNGNAHEISGGDTFFLEAATTGSKNQKYVPQPFSNELAHPRRFALKPAFVTTLLKKEEYLIEDIIQQKEEKLIDDIVPPQVFLLNKLKEYKNISLDEVTSMLGIKKSTQKNFISKVSKKLVEKILLEEYSENIFESLELIHKTCRVYDGKLKEHISFPYMKYDELIQQEWEESNFYQIIESKFMFVFWENVNNEFYLRKIIFWNAPPKEVAEAKRIWERTKQLINDKKAESLPKTTESYFAHVRPHGRDSNDKYPTHYGVDVKKQSFWIHKNYIEENILS